MMITPRITAFGLAIAAGLAAFGAAGGDSEKSLALKGALVYTAAGKTIENAVIIIENGKIAAVGRDVVVPPGLKVLDVAGKVIIPGMIDAYSHIGASVAGDATELSQPISPENRAIDSLHLDIPDWMEAVKAGITTVVTGPGSEARIGGQSVTLKTFGRDLEKRILKEGGELTMAVNGVSLSHISALHSNFLKAREYLGKWKTYDTGGRKGPAPARDLAMEVLAKALQGEETVRVRVLWAHDILSVLKLKDEFGFNLQLIDAPDAWKVADAIAKRDVGVICLPMVLSINVPEDLLNGIPVLNKAGVKIAMHSDYPASPQKWFRLNASMAIRHGLPKDEALKTVTVNPARMAKIDRRVGSIEKGKDADLVILNGPWFEASSRIDMVFVDGVLAFHRAGQEKPDGEGK
jgi:imidazolonepropionase-like amidohydrolase